MGRLRRSLLAAVPMLRGLWSEIGFIWGAIALSYVSTTWLWLAPQPPGVAIGILAFMAVAMTVAALHPLHKAAFMLAAGALLFLELHTIYKDRATQEAQNNAAQAKIHKDFEENLKTILADNERKFEKQVEQSQKEFSATQQSFSSVISTATAINSLSYKTAQLTKENLSNITGGDSWGYVNLIPYSNTPGFLGPEIVNAGKFPLRNVRVMIMDVEMYGLTGTGIAEFFVGDVSPNSNLELPPQTYVKRPTNREIHYFISIRASNGTFIEDVFTRLHDGKNGGPPWVENRYEVYRLKSGGKKTLLRKIPYIDGN